MLARYCGPGLLGLGITALIAGFMSGMAGNVSAFATVWTYDIYRAMFRKRRHRRALRQRGPLVHHSGRAGQHRHGLPGDAVRQHHGLRAGAVQLLHRAAVRHRAAGHVVEARHARRAVSGACWPARSSSIGMWAWVKLDPTALRYIALSPQRQGYGGEHVPRALVVDHLRHRHRGGEPGDEAEARVELVGLVYGCTEIPRKAICRVPAPIFWAGVVRRVRVCRSSSGR